VENRARRRGGILSGVLKLLSKKGKPDGLD
jgi:hypothetical protein